MSLIQKDSEGKSYEILTLPEWEAKQGKPVQDLEGFGGFLNYATGALSKAGQDPEETYGKVQQNLFRVAVDRGLIEAPDQEDPEAPAKLQKAFEGFSNRVSEDRLRDYSLVANSLKDTDPDASATLQGYYDRASEDRKANRITTLAPDEESNLEELKSKYLTLDQVRDARIQIAKENGLAYVDYRADDKGQRGVWVNPDPTVAKDSASILDSFERSNNLISASTLKFARQQIEPNPGRDTARWQDTQNAELQNFIEDTRNRQKSKDPEQAAFAEQIQGALKTAGEYQNQAFKQGGTAEEALKKEVTKPVETVQIRSSFSGSGGPSFVQKGTGKVAEAEIGRAYDNLKTAYPNNALFSQYTRDQFVNAAGDLVKQGLEAPVNNDDPTKNFVKLSDGTYSPLSSTALLPKASFESAMDKLGLDDRAKAAAEVTRKGYLANNADAIEEALEQFDGELFTDFSMKWLDKQDPLARTSKADLIEDYMSEASKRSDWNVFSAKATGIGMSVVKSFNPIIQAIGGGVSSAVGFDSGKQVFLDWAVADATTEANRKKYTNLYGSDLGLGYEFLSQAAPMVADIALTGGASAVAKGAVKGLARGAAVEATEQVAKRGIKGLLATEISIPVGKLVPSSAQEFAGNVTKNWIAKALSPETRTLFGQSYARKFADVATGPVGADSALVAKVFQGIKSDLANKLPRAAGVVTQRASSFARSAQGQYVDTTLSMRAETNSDGSRKFTDDQIHKSALTHSLVSGSITALVEQGFGKVFGEGADAITYGKANLQQLKFYTNRVSGALNRSSLGGEEVLNALKTVTREIVKDSGYQVLKEGGGEFGEEFTDQLAQSVAQSMLTNKDLDVVTALKDSFHAGLLGFGYGAGIHGATTSGVFSKQNIRRDYEQGVAQSVEGRVLSGVIAKLEADNQSPETVAVLKNRMQLAARKFQPVSERIPVRPASADLVTSLDGLEEQPLNIGQRPDLRGPSGSAPTRKASQLAGELNVSAEELRTIQGSGKAVQGAGSTITPNDVEAYVAQRASGLARSSDIDWNDQAAVEAYVTRNGAQFISEGAGEVPSVEETRTFKDLAGRLVVVDGVRGRVRIEEDGVLLDPETGEAPFIVTPNPEMLATEFEGFEGAVAEASEVSPKRGVRKVKLSVSETGQIVYGNTKYDAPTKPVLANVKLAADGSIDSMFVLVQNQNGKPTYAYVTGENAQRLQKIYEDRGPESAQDFKDAVSNSQTQDIQRNQAAANSKQKRSSKRRRQKRADNNAPLVTERGQQAVEQDANYALARINAGVVNQELVSELRAVAVQLGLEPDSFTSIRELFIVVGPELAAGLDLDNFTEAQIEQADKNVQQGNVSTLLEYLVQQESESVSSRAVEAQWFAKLRASHRGQFAKHGIKEGEMDVKTVLQSIARSASNKLHRQTAKFLLDLNVELPPVSVYSAPNDLGRSGMYLPGSNLVVLNGASDNGGGIVDVMLHELMHFGTENLVSNPRNAFEQDVRARLLALRSEIQIKAQAKFGDAMPETLRYAVEGRMSPDEDFNEDTAIREFIVHYYASQKFREQLSDLNTKGERSFVKRFLDIIASWVSGKRVPDPGSVELVETMLDLQKAVADGSGLPGLSLGSVLASRTEAARNAGHGPMFGIPNPFTRKSIDWVAHQTDSMSDGIYSEEQLRELIVNGKFAFLTAENPSKTDAGEEANAAFNARAEQWLKDRGYTDIDRVVGRYVNGENSFLIDGFTDQDAVDFAAEFQQESVATDSGLHYPDGSFEARSGENLDSFYDVDSDDNFFTNVRTKDGKLITVRVSYPGHRNDSGLRVSQESAPAAISENSITRQIQNQKEFAVIVSKESARPFVLEGNVILVNEELADQVFGGYNLEEQASLVERELAVAVAYELAIQKVGFDTYVSFEDVGLNALEVIDRAAKNDLTQADLQDLLTLGKTVQDFVATAFEQIGLRNDSANERLALAQNRLGDLYRYLERKGGDIPDQARAFSDSISPEDLAIVERLKPGSDLAYYSRAYSGIKPGDIKPGQALGTRNPTGTTATELGTDPMSLVSLDVLARDPKAYRTNALYLTEYPIVAREFPELAAAVRALRTEHSNTAVLIRTNADEIKRFKKSLKGLLAVDKRAVTDKVFEDALLKKKGGLKGESGAAFATQQAALEKRLVRSKELKAQSKTEKLGITKILAGWASDPNHEIAELAPQIYKTVVDNTQSNLVALINLFPENIRPIAKLWYDGANKIANEFGSAYAQDVEQSAGVLAVFSPQKDWFMNISLAERTLKIWHDQVILGNPSNIVWGPEMSAQWLKRGGEPQITTEAQDGVKPIYEKGKVKAVYDEAGNHLEDEQGNPLFEGWSSTNAEAGRAKAREILTKLQGKALKDLSLEDQARFIRMYSEVNDPSSYMKYAPDGTNTEEASRSEVSGKDVKIAWGSYSTIQKAIRIMSSDKATKLSVVSSELGNQHKVRSFYNNIVDPNNQDGHVTMDTHAVAALFWQAFSGNSFEVSQNFGSSNVTNNSVLGVNGLYPANAEAYREAAKVFGLLPREIQSITWEAVRLLFTAKWKSNKKNVDAVRAVWARYETDKSFTIEDARAEIFQLATGKDINEAFANTEDLAKSLGFPSWSQVELRAAQPGEVPLKQIRESRAATPQMDADYLAAVEAGDTAAAQRMVDEAAKAAGYSVGPVYHGTPSKEQFDVFEETTGDTGFFFASQKEDASGYGNRVITALLKMGRNYRVTEAEFEAGGLSATQAKEQGYDSFTIDYGNGDVNHAVFDPNQIKSADPITRDANGNVIPLSERFNVVTPDIRFSRAAFEPRVKVNPPNGEPLYITGYHGGTFDERAPMKASAEGTYGYGYYTAPDVERAKGYARETRKESQYGEVTTFDVLLIKPLVVKVPKRSFAQALVFEALGLSPDKAYKKAEDIIEERGDIGKHYKSLGEKQGYDGIVILNEDGTIWESVAWSSESLTVNDDAPEVRFSRAAVAQQLVPTTDQEQKAFAGATKNKRSGELAVAAVRLEQGQMDNDTFASLVEILDPWVVKGADQVPSVDKIKQYIVSRRDGKVLSEDELGKLDKVRADLDIPEGELVDWRIDIPTYNRSLEAGDVVYAITGHKPGGTARAAAVIGYTPIARVRDGKVVTRAEKGSPMIIAQGGGKFPLATVQGKNVKIDRLPADINDPAVWSEIAYNPARSSEFVDVRTKLPVLTFDDAILVGPRVFMKNPTYDSKPQYQQPRVDLSGALTGETDVRYSRSAAPALFRGRDVQLTHWSFDASLKQTDPKMHGTGGIGVEKSRQQGYKEIYQPRTYFGYSSYTREQVVGPHRYQIKVSGDSLYDYESDPLSLYPTREDRKAAGYAQFDDVAARTMYEKAIKDSGYAGYVSKSYSAGVLFGKHKVTKVADSDRSLALSPKPIQPKVMLSRAVRAVTSPDIESAYRVSLDDLVVNEVTGEFNAGNKFTRLFRASGNLDPRMFEAKQYQERAKALADLRLVGLKDTFMNALKSEPNTDLDDVNDALGSTAPTVPAAARAAAALRRDQAIEGARTQYEETDKAYANYKKATTQARADYLVHQSSSRYQQEVSQLQGQLASSIEKQTRDAAIVAANAAYDQEIQAARAKGAKAALATQQQALLRLEQNSPKVAFAVTDFRSAIDSVSQQLVESFGPADPLRAVITDNLGVYLTRSYAIHHDEGYADKIKNDPTFARTRQEARDYFERAWVDRTFKDWRSNDLYAIYSDQEVRSLVEAEAKAKSIGSIELDSFIEMHGATPEVPGRVLNKTDLSRFMEKGEVPRELRVILGEMQNPIENALRTYSNVTNFLGTQRLLNDFTRIGTSNGWLITAQDKAQNPEKYRAYEPLVNSTKTSGGDPLSNFYAPPEIKEAFKLTFSPEHKAKQGDALELMKKLDSTLAFAIGSSLGALTLGSAGFYVRNLTSNVIYMAANGFVASPSNIADSLQALNEIYGTNFWNRALQSMPQGLRPDEKVNFSELGPLGADLIALGLKDSLSAGVLQDLFGGLSGSDPSGFVSTLEQVIRNKGKVAATAVDVTKKVAGVLPATVRSFTSVAESLDLLYKFAYYSHMVQVYTEANAYETIKWTDAQIRQKAARTVRRTTQGRSEQPAIAKAFAKSQLGTLFNSFIRFSVETVRLPFAMWAVSSEERSSGNPVLIRRGRWRLSALGAVLASSAISSAVKAIYGFDDDEEQAIRNALPPWAKNVNYYFTRDSKDPTKIKAWNLTYVHPFSMITDPFIRASHLVLNGRADEAPEVLLDALVGAFASPQIAVDALAQLRTNTDARGGKIWYENDSTVTAVGKGFKYLMNSAYRLRTPTKFYEAFEAYTNNSIYDEDARLATAAELVAGEFSPFQTKKYDLVKLSRQAFSKIKRDQDEVSVERGKLKTAKPLSSQDVEEIYSDLEDARIFAAKKLAKTVAGFEKLGVSKQELARQANDVGISRDRFSQVVNRGVVDRVVFPKELLQELKEIGGEANGAARVQFLKDSINSRPSKIQLNND